MGKIRDNGTECPVKLLSLGALALSILIEVTVQIPKSNASFHLWVIFVNTGPSKIRIRSIPVEWCLL